MQSGHQLARPPACPTENLQLVRNALCVGKGGVLSEGHKGGVVERWAEHRISFFLPPVVSSQALFPWQPPAGDRETAVKGSVPALF